MRPGSRKWTAEDVSTLKSLVARHAEIREMRTVLGRSTNSIRRKIFDEGLSEAPAQQGARFVAQLSHLIPPAHFHRDITSRLCGDPPPNRSALAQRQGRS